MKPTKPMFKWRPFDYLDPLHLQKTFARVRREQAEAKKQGEELELIQRRASPYRFKVAK